jgi:hypothetical protein
MFDSVKEWTVIGKYPGFKGMEDVRLRNAEGNYICPDTDRYYRPIPVHENFKMFFRGETPYWMPNIGWFFCDVQEFRPRQGQDCVAHHQCLDGGPVIDYSNFPKVINGWLELPQEWEAVSCGATVRPGNPILEDMNDWKEIVQWPEIDKIDYENMKEMNKEYLGTDRVNQLGIHLGLWERMMAIMDASNAAIALADEDQEDAVKAFLDRLADMYIEYISLVAKIGRIDSVMLHDDWGTHTGPFFSLDTAMKFFVPPMKKIVDHCHGMGIIFEHHCCGKAEKLVPAMVATGSDFWFPQPAINDVDTLIEEYKNEHIKFAVGNPVLPKGSTREEIRTIAKEFVDKYSDKKILFCSDSGKARIPNHDTSLWPVFRDAVYEYSRKAYQELPVPEDMEKMVIEHHLQYQDVFSTVAL